MGIKKWKAEIVQTHNLGSTLDGDVFGRHRITDADGRVVVEGDMAGKDAKAIAATPDLLIAARKMVEAANCKRVGAWADAYEALHASISKAEGR